MMITSRRVLKASFIYVLFCYIYLRVLFYIIYFDKNIINTYIIKINTKLLLEINY